MVYLLQHLLINSAEQYPQKEAVIYGEERITYKKLDEITDKLAALLLENGIKRGDRIGIYMNKSIASVISIFGILKASAIYVPIDPNAPLSRIDYIIRNCGIRCLLTSSQRTEKLSELLAERLPLELVVLTDDFGDLKEVLPVKIIRWMDVIKGEEHPLPKTPTIETDLAYILYTSGSTGVPKGVMISHLNALTFIDWAYETFNLDFKDRVSNHAPLHFDLSIFDIFATFKAGATLVIVPDMLSMFPIRLAEWIENNQISVWYSVPSILTMMVLNGQLGRYRYSDLRSILFAGEVFPTKYLRELMAIIPHVEYYNLYGPTETNVITYYKVEQILPEQIKPVPIGKACNNMDVFALQQNGELVAEPGQEGELYARGSCLAQGYWGDEEKTSRCFLINHKQRHFQEKMYKTGDLVTIDENGNYIYLGRRDHMIKSRGYRIELGDIETALYSHPGISEAVAVAVPDDMIGNRIKAFVVLNNKNLIDLIDLQTHCAERIPKYMVPESIQFCDVLPKTSTGKIDRTALVKM
jgi:amino acid adenylation domain-containing protein